MSVDLNSLTAKGEKAMDRIMRIRDLALFLFFVVNVFWKKDSIPFVDEIAMGLGLLAFTWIQLIEWAGKNQRWRIVVVGIRSHSYYKFLKVGYMLAVILVIILTAILLALLPHDITVWDEVIIAIVVIIIFARLYTVYRASKKREVLELNFDN